jgi:tetratricopeptide (TPR) repeat protein
MLDPDELYFSSDEYRALLDELGENIEKEDMAERGCNSIKASEYGLKVWSNLLELKKMLCAHSIYELQEGHTTIYDLLYWATRFADELHNAGLIDKSFETEKIQFCETYVEMHRDMFDKEVRNLGNIRVSLADSYYRMGKVEKADSLFREWLSVEPDWGWGWIGWSDSYWLWEVPGLNRDFHKAKRILKEGLSVPNVSDRNHLEQRLKDLKELEERMQN